EFAKRRADELTQTRWDVLSAKIDTQGPGTPLVVFNALGWPRTDVVEVEVGFAEGNVGGVSITDAEGKTVPAQVLEATRYHDGGLKTAKVAFVARDVPAVGYRMFHAAPARDRAPTETQSASGPVLENELYRVTF